MQIFKDLIDKTVLLAEKREIEMEEHVSIKSNKDTILEKDSCVNTRTSGWFRLIYDTANKPYGVYFIDKKRLLIEDIHVHKIIFGATFDEKLYSCQIDPLVNELKLSQLINIAIYLKELMETDDYCNK